MRPPCIPNARPPQTYRSERRATLKHLQNRARYCKITRGLEAYRSGHNEPHSKCGDGQPSASSNLAASAKAKRHPHTGAFFAFSETRCGTLRLTTILSKNGCFPRSNRTNRQMGAKFGGFFARRLRLFRPHEGAPHLSKTSHLSQPFTYAAHIAASMPDRNNTNGFSIA